MHSMKKLLAVLFITLMALSVPSLVQADGTTTEETVCTTGQYGNKTCTTTKKEVTVHEPVDAALGDINPGLIAVVFMVLGYGTLVLAKKVQV